ncbi:MAG: carboxy terminal-processing peptidase, partial [Planctomycetales bacterium]
PEGKGETKIIDITRDRIELTDSEARSEIIEDGEKPNGKPYKIGVIDLPSFYMDMDAANQGVPDYKSTTTDVRKLLQEFNKREVDAVIVDLRDNGGGSLPEAVDVTGLFIDEGPTVQIKDAEGAVRQHKDTDRGVAWDGPLVVLISKFSASASEIFAGAIKDYQRGLVVGDHATHGKGTVQTLMDVGQQLYRIQNAPKLGALKITMQQFYRPNGDSTQNRGVLSHVELPWITTHLDVGESDLDYAVAFDNIKPATFPKMKQIDDTLVAILRQSSEKRRQQSKDFQKLNNRIAKYLEQKKTKSISLNEEVFMSDRAELDDQDKVDKEEIDKQKVVNRNYYFDEALAITVDYVRMLGKGQVAGK